MYKKLFAILLLSFLVIGAASAASIFEINEGYDPISDESAFNEKTNMYLDTWDYDDELVQEYYLQNASDYSIVSGDNDTYNITYDSVGQIGDAVSYLSNGTVALDHGIMEIVEVDGKKYIIMTYKELGTKEDWKICYDELMKFNENNNLEPIPDAI